MVKEERFFLTVEVRSEWYEKGTVRKMEVDTGGVRERP